MPETAALEARCFPSSWTEEQFSEAWKQSWFAGYGLFQGARLIGYIVLSILAEEVEVLNIALLPEFRGQHLSKKLMAFALSDTLNGNHCYRKGLDSQGWKNVFLEVRIGNVPAKALYASLGFIEIGVRRHYYSNGEDAIIMALNADNFQC